MASSSISVLQHGFGLYIISHSLLLFSGTLLNFVRRMCSRSCLYVRLLPNKHMGSYNLLYHRLLLEAVDEVHISLRYRYNLKNHKAALPGTTARLFYIH